MEEKNKCPICGEITSSYMGHFRKDGLCRKHATYLKEGKIIAKENGKSFVFCDAKTGNILNQDYEKKTTYKELPTEGFDRCVICGEKTQGFAFCHKCYKAHTTDDLLKILCSVKGVDESSDKASNTDEKNSKVEKVKLDDHDDLRCIICGAPSDGKHFCKACYHKYRDRAIDLRITHCNEVEILDDYGNLQYKCDDGRKVRSRAEMIISNFLYNNKVRSVYEETVYYKDEKGVDKTLHPDFYLPDYDMYIEYNELTNKPYLKSKEYVMRIYKGLGKKVLIMNEKDLTDIAAFLKPQLGLH